MYCPLIILPIIGTGIMAQQQCREEECAWWYVCDSDENDSCCSIKELANSLHWVGGVLDK